jgi:pyruvate dehydrogenase E1 component beta subunit
MSSLCNRNPIIFIEHFQLYGWKGEVPEEEYLVPFGKAAIRREGTDITLVSWGWMVHKALAAANQLAQEGISTEVIDLRTLKPWDQETVISSVRKTKRLVIVHEAVRMNGFGAEIAATVGEEAFDSLDAPIKRVTAPDTPIPFSPVLEDAFLPNELTIAEAMRSLL